MQRVAGSDVALDEDVDAAVAGWAAIRSTGTPARAALVAWMGVSPASSMVGASDRGDGGADAASGVAVIGRL